jgi:glycosyltransferase domain-containing protein
MRLNNLTIVIPTHERHALLKRALHYYHSLGLSIIIADSSGKRYKGNIPDSAVYMHLNGYSFSNKILFALSKACTTYTCFCADDDFLSSSGLTKGIEFLNKHQDYISVQGHYISFKIVKGLLQKFIIYHQRLGYKVEQNSPSERLVQAFSPYMQHFYALHRTEALVKSMELASKAPGGICAEVSVPLISMLMGKHKTLPIFWMARDSVVYTDNIALKIWTEYLNSDEGDIFSKQFAKFYHSYSCGTEEQGKILIKKIFSIHDNYSMVKIVGYREKLKKLLPQFIVVLIRIIKSSYYKNLYREIHTIKLRILRTPGYPWADKTAKQEWQQMEKIITENSVDIQ